jgi:uncharacterized protein YeaO (DUF488 family)
MDDAEAHNAAAEAVDYTDRYWAHLEESADASADIEYVRSLLADGETVVLVCFENTDQKRCHRTLLKEHLKKRV